MLFHTSVCVVTVHDNGMCDAVHNSRQAQDRGIWAGDSAARAMFRPDKPGFQNMACAREIWLRNSGQTVKVPLSTMWHVRRDPQATSTFRRTFQSGAHDPEEAKLSDRLITATNVLHSDHFYDQLPPGEERPKLIAQMAHWIQKGKKSENPLDTVSTQSIRDDMLSKTKLTYDSLSSSDKKTIDAMCAQIFKASNCTLKLAQSPQMDSLLAGAQIK